MKSAFKDKLVNIIEGWYLLLTLQFSKMGKERYKVCKGCPNMTKAKTCRACGCFLPAKVLVKYEECPFLFWLKSVD